MIFYRNETKLVLVNIVVCVLKYCNYTTNLRYQARTISALFLDVLWVIMKSLDPKHICRHVLLKIAVNLRQIYAPREMRPIQTCIYV